MKTRRILQGLKLLVSVTEKGVELVDTGKRISDLKKPSKLDKDAELVVIRAINPQRFTRLTVADEQFAEVAAAEKKAKAEAEAKAKAEAEEAAKKSAK